MASNLQNKIFIIVAIAIALVILSFASTFVIPEGRQAVITQFGKPIRSVNEAGLHFKLPFIQEVRRIDLRILSWDGFPNQIPTKDKKYIEVDTTARWKIVDPLKFIQTVQDERGARSRLDAILDGITRDVISNHNLVEAVRNSNQILEIIENRNKATKAAQQEGVFNEQEEFIGEIESIQIGREKLSELIIEKARQELVPLGIQLIDVQLKRISYEDSVQQKVYGRMISERERIAERIRSYGKGEKAKIEGKTQKDLQTIESEAYRKVQQVRGNAEAEAISVYAKALSQDPSFYRFIRSLEAYDKLPKDTKLLLSSESKFWKVFKSGNSN
ncbi:MAG: protease modulator HflC [Bdellovibrionales bacterium]|nr:protease modulator HflC [Bdellovibrionales bacterium]